MFCKDESSSDCYSLVESIINSLGLALTMGGAVLAAQFKGAGDAQGQRDCVSMLLFASLSCLLYTSSSAPPRA